MQKITPFLWFDGKAEEATNFYVSIFKNSKVVNVRRSGAAGTGAKGSVISTVFEIDGQEFYTLNGGPHFSFTPAVSFFINCETQDEVDAFWEKLSEGGGTHQCGWLHDKFGVTWQIVPSVLWKLLHGSDAKKSAAAMRAMMQMDKLDIQRMQEAYDQG